MRGLSDSNGLIAADAGLGKHGQHQQPKLTRKAATGGSRPLPMRKPPHVPRRRVEPAAAAAAPVNPVGGDSLRVPSAFEQCLELAKVMISPQGLAMKKVTLEGFTVPIALRLLDRRQQQQSIGGLASSSETAVPASAVSDELSITWLEQDMFGFDVRRLTGIRRGEDVEDPHEIGSSGQRWGVVGGAGARRRRNEGTRSGDYYNNGGRDEKDSRTVVLSWSMGGGPAEVVLQAASRQQRNLVAVTLEMVLSGLQDAEETGTTSDDETSGGAARAVDGPAGRGEVQLRQQSGLGASCSSSSSGELEHPAGTSPNDHAASDPMAGVENEDPQAAEETLSPAAAAAAAGDLVSAGVGRAAAAAAAAIGKTRTVTADGGGGGRLRFAEKNVTASSSSSPPAAVIPRREDRRTINITTAMEHSTSTSTSAAPTRRLHPRGASCGPGGGDFGSDSGVEVMGVVPALTRSRTFGGSLGRESLAEQQRRQEEEDEHARIRRQDAMARLLLVYDRAKDESVAAAWRLGVSGR